MDTKTIINIENAGKSFRVKTQTVQVLKEINLKISEGEFVIIFGPSGCGKSTLLHIILGLEPPSSGITEINNWRLYDFGEDQRSELRKNYIGMIYQQPNWIKAYTVLENVAFAASLKGVKTERARERALELLDLVGMADWADYKPTELSSGQQQKIALARALITDPKVIVADEPTGNLDYRSGLELMELFQKLNKEGKTVIMVTHNIDNVDYSSKVVQMFDGKIINILDTQKLGKTEIKKMLLEKRETGIEPAIVSVRQEGKFVRRRYIPPQLNRKNLFQGFWLLLREMSEIFHFIGVLGLYIGRKAVQRLACFRLMPRFIVSKLAPLFSRLDRRAHRILAEDRLDTISHIDLIDLSLKNMFSKKTRSLITIGGMAIGIGIIVFLVSIGYGLEKLVVSRVARLEEMRQTDAIPAVASNIRLDNKSLNSFRNIPGVAKVLPVIGVVGKINYNNSNSDVAVYGVLSDYLKESAIRPSSGKIFTANNLLSLAESDLARSGSAGEVAGIITIFKRQINARFGQNIGDVQFKINPEEYIRVRKNPDPQAELIGYARRTEGQSQAVEIWGRQYLSDDNSGQAGSDDSGQPLGKWLRATVPLWEKSNSGYTEKKDSDGKQAQAEGYMAEVNLKVEGSAANGSVLGVTTSTASAGLADSGLTASDEAAVLLEAGVVDTGNKDAVKQVTLGESAQRQAVVNKQLLKILGLFDSQAVGSRFSINFVATSDLVGQNKRVESNKVEYTIIGVVPDGRTPLLYVPLADLQGMLLKNYSQAKIVVADKNRLPMVRKQIEVLGYKTSSVVDTVSQIERLFGSVRLVLGLLGVVALAVAALGMFNTLTISLMERTHEVGMMKAIGMRSDEVKELFLTESMIMGIFGGVSGLLIGFLLGKLASFVLSMFAVFRGVGILDISYVPTGFVLLIGLLSLFVGVLTGIYPAYRATKISALDALRYE